MNLHTLQTTPGSRKKAHRIARGDGSGWGGTAGRGEKGQRSRSGASIRHHFEGGQTPSFRRIPKRGFNSGVKEIFNVVNVGDINECFESGDTITEIELRTAGLIGKADRKLKILGYGEVTKALNIKAVKFSASAKAKVEAAGGTVTVE